MENLILNAEPRSEIGTRAVKKLRQAGRLPANLYGQKKENTHLTLDAREFVSFLHAGHRILSLRVGSRDERSVVKEVQYDYMGTEIVHVDFTRISEHEAIEVEVPLELLGHPKGVTKGGILDFPHKEVLVRGLPQALPESISINVEPLDLGDVIRIRDLPAVENCSYVEGEDVLILSVVAPKAEAEAEPGAEEASEPEVIQQKKDDEGESS